MPTGDTYCHLGNVRIVLDRTEDHVVEYTWKVGELTQPARFVLHKVDIETGSRRVALAQLAATLELRYTEHGQTLPPERTRRVSAFLAPWNQGPEVPLERGGSQLVAAGGYDLFVNAEGWKGMDPTRLTLSPGEVRSLVVPLEKPRLYEQAWFPWAVVGAVVVTGAVVGGVLLLGGDDEGPPAPVWSVPIE